MIGPPQIVGLGTGYFQRPYGNLPQLFTWCSMNPVVYKVGCSLVTPVIVYTNTSHVLLLVLPAFLTLFTCKHECLVCVLIMSAHFWYQTTTNNWLQHLHHHSCINEGLDLCILCNRFLILHVLLNLIMMKRLSLGVDGDTCVHSSQGLMLMSSNISLRVVSTTHSLILSLVPFPKLCALCNGCSLLAITISVIGMTEDSTDS